jgi:tRNA pseudouridine13 synthase
MNSILPEADKLAGMGCYCTAFKGIGGLIKLSSEQFKVFEIVDDSYLKDISNVQDTCYRYPLYLLEKQNIDSNHAVLEITKAIGLRLKIIGIKDAKAVTRQYASSEQTNHVPRESKTAHTRIHLMGFTKTPIRKSSLHGNGFNIKIYKPLSSDISAFEPEIKNIVNYYGLQRFGSGRLVTHLVGKEIVTRNFKKATELLLSYNSPFDSAIITEIRKKSSDPANYSQVIGKLPKGMDIEYNLMSALLEGKDSVGALRTIPITIRRLFVQAYQAYIFNRCLTNAILDGEDMREGKDGDLCFEVEDSLAFGRIRKFNPSVDVDPSKVMPAIMLAGYAFQTRKSRFETITRSIMQADGITPRDFYIKEMQELSAQGGFRQAPLSCRDFSFSDSLEVSFKLPTGSYATTLLRELMKPQDPILSGF